MHEEIIEKIKAFEEQIELYKEGMDIGIHPFDIASSLIEIKSCFIPSSSRQPLR